MSILSIFLHIFVKVRENNGRCLIYIVKFVSFEICLICLFWNLSNLSLLKSVQFVSSEICLICFFEICLICLFCNLSNLSLVICYFRRFLLLNYWYFSSSNNSFLLDCVSIINLIYWSLISFIHSLVHW